LEHFADCPLLEESSRHEVRVTQGVNRTGKRQVFEFLDQEKNEVR
jgi:hypothetical protein